MTIIPNTYSIIGELGRGACTPEQAIEWIEERRQLAFERGRTAARLEADDARVVEIPDSFYRLAQGLARWDKKWPRNTIFPVGMERQCNAELAVLCTLAAMLANDVPTQPAKASGQPENVRPSTEPSQGDDSGPVGPGTRDVTSNVARCPKCGARVESVGNPCPERCADDAPVVDMRNDVLRTIRHLMRTQPYNWVSLVIQNVDAALANEPPKMDVQRDAIRYRALRDDKRVRAAAYKRDGRHYITELESGDALDRLVDTAIAVNTPPTADRQPKGRIHGFDCAQRQGNVCDCGLEEQPEGRIP